MLNISVADFATDEARAANARGIALLGIRDVAAGAALTWLHSMREQSAMGVIVIAWTVVVGFDAWVAAQGPKGVDGGIVGLLVGTVGMGFVGLGLYQS